MSLVIYFVGIGLMISSFIYSLFALALELPFEGKHGRNWFILLASGLALSVIGGFLR